MKKYWTILKLEIATVLEYRAVPLTWALAEIISLASGIFLWTAIFRDQTNVGQYNLKQMMLYYSLIPLVGIFTYTYVCGSLPKRIKDGRISLTILKPHNIATGIFLHAISINIVQFLLKAPIFLASFLWLSRLFNVSFKLEGLGIALLICFLAYLLHFFLDLCLSYIAFWVDDIWALEHLKFLAIMVFGGLSFPLSLLPDIFQPIFNFLPFRFFYYFPISIVQGILPFSQIWIGILQILIWTLFFYIFSRVLWGQGIKKYGAYGN